MSRSTRNISPVIVLLALAYFVAGRLGLLLPAFGSSITLIWLPTGIAVAALLRWGFRCWPGIALGAVAVNFTDGLPWPAILGIAVGNTLAPLLTAWTLRRTGFHPTFDRQRDILMLAAAALPGMLVAATVGVTTLALAGMLPAHRTAAWLTWWAGDTMGVILAAPLVLTCTRAAGRAILRRRAEFVLWLALPGLVSLGVFILDRSLGDRAWALAFVPLPMVVWAALRFGPAGTSLALIVLAVGAAYGPATGHGPLFRVNPSEGSVVLWLYMAMSVVFGWLISALHLERTQATGVRRLFEQALSDVSLGVLLAGLDRRITYVNQGFTSLTGYSEADLLGKSCALLQGPETNPEVLARLKAATHGDGFFDGEILNYRKDGTTFWNGLLISPVRDEGGAMTGFLAIQRDVSQRKQAELALRESEDRFRMLADHTDDIISLHSPNGNRLYLSPSYYRKTGWTDDDLKATHWRTRVHPDDLNIVAAAHEENEAGKDTRVEHRVLRKDGAWLWLDVSCVAIRDDKGGVHHLLVSMHDITERKRAEQERAELLHALQESQVRLQTLVTHLPGMAYRCLNDPNWTMSYVSEGCEAVTGYQRDELENNRAMAYADLINSADRDWLRAKREASLELRAPCQNEYRIRDRHGRERWVSERASGAYAPDGTLLAIDGFIQDITERRQAAVEREALDRKMQETQKLESLGVLAGGIAHDFNNLLNAILGNASIAQIELPPGSPVRDCIEQITEASQRAADLCKQMLAYSGRGRFVVQKLDLGQLVEQTAQMLQVSISKKAVLRYHLEKGLPPIEVDATQIRQVIMNLVINASEAIGEASGVISISTGLIRVDHDYRDGTLMDPDLPDSDCVFLEVSDSGCGMSAETKARIFDPFFTTKFTGRGLGLAAVLGIVRGHKGALKVYSEPGRGTTFKLLFPAAEGASETALSRPVGSLDWHGEGTVLVVDDEEAMRTTVARMMGIIGLVPVLACDGREAVEIFRATPDRFALVLLDLTMPHMDGAQTFTELRRLRPEVRVVLMSGFNAQEALVRFTGKGLASFLQKPFTIDTLRSTIQEVLEEISTGT